MRADRAERRWVFWFAVVAMLATTVPYALGYALQGADWRYSGFLFGIEDGNSYIAKMLSGSAGSWLFRTPYTASPQPGTLAFLPYILLGKMAAPPGTHEQLVALFHLFRIAGGIAMMLASYDFVALFTRSVAWRRAGMAASALGGGLGWLVLFGLSGLWSGGIPGLEMPLEFYSPETFGFLMILGLPHLEFARAFLLWGLIQYLAPPGERSFWQAGWRGGLLWLGVGLMQPLTVVVGWAVLGLHLVSTGLWQAWQARKRAAPDWVNWRAYFKRAVVIGAVSSPIVLITFLTFQLDPVLHAWTAQNLIPSPPAWHYLLAYGLLLVPAVLGAVQVVRADPWRGWLAATWMLGFPLLAYAPYPLQRRLPEGIWVVLCALTAAWISTRTPRARGFAWAGSAAIFFSSLLLFGGGLIGVANHAAPLYLPTAETRAFRFLSENAPARSVVLGSYSTANALPAYAYVRTINGHGPESIGLAEINPRVTCFYISTCSDGARLALIADANIRYVFWGPAERALGGWDPSGAPFLRVLYGKDGYAIYEVSGYAGLP